MPDATERKPNERNPNSAMVFEVEHRQQPIVFRQEQPMATFLANAKHTDRFTSKGNDRKTTPEAKGSRFNPVKNRSAIRTANNPDDAARTSGPIATVTPVAKPASPRTIEQ